MAIVHHLRIRSGINFVDIIEDFPFPDKVKPYDKISLTLNGKAEVFVIETLPAMTGEKFICVCRPNDPYLQSA